MANKVFYGVLIGIVLPALAYILTTHTDIVAQIMPSKPIGLYVIAMTINIVAVWYCYRNDLQNIGRGIVLITFLAMLLGILTKTITIA